MLLDMLCDESNCEMFGPELTNVILKDVLSIRASWFSLTGALCHGESVARLNAPVVTCTRVSRSTLGTSL